MEVIRELKFWWNLLFNFNHRCRQMDLRILWPQCCELAPDLDHAKAAFAVHALNDPAWLELGHDVVVHVIDNLEAPDDRHR